MGSRSKLNQFHKQEQKEKVLAQPGMEVFKKLQRFYKLHPKSTHQVVMEVDNIRKECEAFTKVLSDRFEKEHASLMSEYLKKELDYLESFLTPEEKARDAGIEMQGVVDEILKEDPMVVRHPSPDVPWYKRLFK